MATAEAPMIDDADESAGLDEALLPHAARSRERATPLPAMIKCFVRIVDLLRDGRASVGAGFERFQLRWTLQAT
jgi:hypothetical protein